MRNLMIYFFALLLVACSSTKSEVKQEDNIAESEIPVRVQTVKQKNVQIPIFASGIVAPQSEIKLSFKTGGVIEQIFVNEGATVYRGQLLARLNMSEIAAQVSQAQLGLEKAKRDLTRAKNLYADSVATLEQVQNASTAQDLSASSLRIAEFNQQYSAIYSPVSGKVLRKYTESNELIGPSMPVLLIGSTESAWVVNVALTDKDVVRIKLGDKASVKMDAHPNVVFEASVSQIAQTANPQTGTYEVELLVNNQNYNLIAGFIAQAEILPQNNDSQVVIPIGALVEADGDKGYVYRLNPDKKSVTKTLIKIQNIYQNEVILVSGLDVNAEIVVEGTPYLRDKAKIRIVK